MSIALKKIKSILLLLFTVSCSSQNGVEKKEINVFFDLKDKAINKIYVNRDSTEARFSIYVEKYQTKVARDKATNDYYNDPRERNSAGIPSFTGSFISLNKPMKINSLEGIDILTLKQFRDKLFPQGYPMYFIYKSEEGCYLKWEVIHITY